MEIVDYLHHVGLGHVPRLTRLEWSVIKNSLGRPRRFSERFLRQERDKLKQYREFVRKHLAELRTCAREGLPTDLARPLPVGSKVIAILPKTREMHDGKLLTMDHYKCSVLFDCDDLGVEFVMDIDCMPLNPLEYMHEGLRRQIDKCLLGDTNRPILQGKISAINASKALQATNNQSYITAYNKARAFEIRRTLAMQRTLNEKEIEPKLLETVKGSKSRAQAMVVAAIKAASFVKGETRVKKIQEALDSVGKHQPLHCSMVLGIKQRFRLHRQTSATTLLYGPRYQTTRTCQWQLGSSSQPISF